MRHLDSHPVIDCESMTAKKRLYLLGILDLARSVKTNKRDSEGYHPNRNAWEKTFVSKRPA